MANDGEDVNEEEIVVDSRMGGSLDELIKYVALYVRRPVYLSGLVLPFVPLYLFVFYVWIFVYGLEDFHFRGLVAIVTIVLVHLLTILWCFWSAHVVAFVNCQRVKVPAEGVFAKVVPTSSNGSPRMVRVQRAELFDGTEHFYFFFRRTQYVWDDEMATFHSAANALQRNYPPPISRRRQVDEAVSLA